MMLEERKNMDIRIVRRDDLVDIRDVEINFDLRKEDWINCFVRLKRNPYCLKVENALV